MGRISFVWLTRMGYMGPKRRPMHDTATAFSTSEGTTQMVTSSLKGNLTMKGGVGDMKAYWMAKKA